MTVSFFVEMSCNCAGIILLNKDNSFVLVESSKQKNLYSFPKGKREKGEDTMATAIRETFEETGLSRDCYEIIPNMHYIEYLSFQGFSKAHMIYYIGIINETKFKGFTPINDKEIISCNFFTINEIQNLGQKFSKQRKTIASKVYEKVKLFRKKF